MLLVQFAFSWQESFTLVNVYKLTDRNNGTKIVQKCRT